MTARTTGVRIGRVSFNTIPESMEHNEDTRKAAEEFIRDVVPDDYEVEFIESGGGSRNSGHDDGYTEDVEWTPDPDCKWDPPPVDTEGLPEDERKFYEYVIMDLHEGASELIEEQQKFLKALRAYEDQREEDALQAVIFGIAIGLMLSR